MRIPTSTGHSKGRSIAHSPETLVNLYAERAPESAKSPVIAHGTPGYSLFSTIASSLIRGTYTSIADGTLYVIAGQTLYSVNSAGTASSIGTIAGAGRIFWAESSVEIVIVDAEASQSYTYNATEGLEQIADGDFPGATSVTYFDGYFVFANKQVGSKDQFFISSLLDGEMYDALDFASSSDYPDNIVRVYSYRSELYIFGDRSIEVWFNSGNADFPFTPAQGSTIDQGLGAAHSIQTVDEAIIFLDHEGIVRRIQGTTPVRISTHAEEYQISKGDWANATSWAYTMEGHQFYALTVPTVIGTSQEASTMVWDAATGRWHRRKSYESDYYKVDFYTYAYGKHLVGDIETAKLYELSLDVYDDAGQHQIAEMQFPQIQNDGLRFIVNKFQLDLEVGLYIPPTLVPGSAVISTIGARVTEGVDEGTLFPDTRGPDGSTLNNGGTLLLIACLRSSPEEGAITSYALSSAADISTAGSEKTLSVDSQDRFPDFALFSWDGTKLFMHGQQSSQDYHTYTCSTAWDITTATFTQTDRIANFGDRFRFNADGTVVFSAYSIPGNPFRVKEWALSTAFDFSTATLTQTIDISRPADTSFADISFSDDGTIFYAYFADAVGSSDSYVYVYELESAYTITSLGTPDNSITFLNGEGMVSLQIDEDASKMVGCYQAVGEDAPFIAEWAITTSSTSRSVDRTPMVMLKESKDGGRTYNKRESWRSIGKPGEYAKRVVWWRRGVCRTYTPKICISDKVKRAIYTAYVDIEPCDS